MKAHDPCILGLLLPKAACGTGAPTHMQWRSPDERTDMLTIRSCLGHSLLMAMLDFTDYSSANFDGSKKIERCAGIITYFRIWNIVF